MNKSVTSAVHSLVVLVAAYGMPGAGQTIIKSTDNGGRHEEARLYQRQKAQRSHRKIGEADLADHGQRAAIFDLKDTFGGKSRLGDLADTGDEQPHADAPEYEPLADQQHEVRVAAAEKRFDNHRNCRQDEQEKYDENEIHGAPSVMLPRMKRSRGAGKVLTPPAGGRMCGCFGD
jgi:hypothetical protein